MQYFCACRGVGFLGQFRVVRLSNYYLNQILKIYPSILGRKIYLIVPVREIKKVQNLYISSEQYNGECIILNNLIRQDLHALNYKIYHFSEYVFSYHVSFSTNYRKKI